MPNLLHSDQVGRIEGILVRPKRKIEPTLVQEWDPSSAADHGRATSKRGVTFIQKEHLAVIAAISGQEIAWEKTRRNVLVSGINLMSLIGHRFQVGEAIFEGTCLIDPCEKMEAALGHRAYAAMVGHGGVGGRLIQAGRIFTGAEIRWLGPANQVR